MKTSSPDREALCRRCGRCCYEKFIVDGRVFTTRTPCKFLDEKTMLCKVYGERFEKNPKCLTVEQGIEFGVFPADCPYVRGRGDYLPAEEGWLDGEVVRKIERGTIYRYEDVAAEVKRQGRQRRARH